MSARLTAPDLPVRVERDLIRVAGPDAVGYLQGQLSADIAALGVSDSTWSLLLDPSGKCVAWLRVLRVGDDELTLDVDAGWADIVVARLTRFLLRTKATVEVTHRGATVTPPLVADEVARIGAGVPAMGAEITPGTIPAELGQWLVDGSVSFTKGCYTGQELVARVDARGGNVPRRLRVLTITGGPVPEPGHPVSVGGAEVGSITSAAPLDDGAVALAFIRRNALDAAIVEVAGAQAEVTVPEPGGDGGS